MIIRVETLAEMSEFEGVDQAELERKLMAIEGLIRSRTNNNFQNRTMRIEAPVSGGVIVGASPYFKNGDTLQISGSAVNDGLYVIQSISESSIAVNEELYDYPTNTVTKIIYPVEIQKGVIDLLIWEKNNREKVGIKSETISRHSVTYYDQDQNNQDMGYPVTLLGFLKPYMKPRF